MHQLTLVTNDKKLERYNLLSSGFLPFIPSVKTNRIAYAAAHVVPDPLRQVNPLSSESAIDWDATLAYREYLWSMGFKVAEAMDTSQRGMGLDWKTSRELIERSIALAKTTPGADLACGAGTDQITDFSHLTLDDVKKAYIEQIEAVEAAGGRVILMASRALASVAKNRDDYISLYSELIQGCQSPVILHWLGEMFDANLKGYWGSNDVSVNMQTVLDIIGENEAKVDGIKISLLEKEYEFSLRKALPESVKMFTGDDFNYPELIEGDGEYHSHALLGIFDPIAPVAARALEQLALGKNDEYRALMEPTIALSRKIFEAPTQYYKAGVVFLAWLNGHQAHFCMAGGMQSARSISHYCEVFRLADAAGVIKDPQLAIQRMKSWLQVHGINQ